MKSFMMCAAQLRPYAQTIDRFFGGDRDKATLDILRQ
jgi:hypothetical protein